MAAELGCGRLRQGAYLLGNPGSGFSSLGMLATHLIGRGSLLLNRAAMLWENFATLLVAAM